MNMHPGYVGELERGERDASLTTLYRVASALQFKPAKLHREMESHLRKETRGSRVPSLSREMKDLRAHMDASPLMMWLAGPGQKNMYTNRPLLDFLGLPLEEVTGDKWRAVMHPEDLAARDQVTRTAFATRRPYTYHYRIRDKSQAFVWIVQQALPIFIKGKYLGHLGTMIPDAIFEGKTGPVVFEVKAGPKPRQRKS